MTKTSRYVSTPNSTTPKHRSLEEELAAKTHKVSTILTRRTSSGIDHCEIENMLGPGPAPKKKKK
jgi:hypothetical protein